MNKSKAKGTRAESAVVAYLNANGFPGVERRTLAGANDKGDIAGLPITVEVKDCATMKLAEWVDEATVEAANAGDSIGVAWHKRRGKMSPGSWYATMTGHDLVMLLEFAVKGGLR